MATSNVAILLGSVTEGEKACVSGLGIGQVGFRAKPHFAAGPAANAL
jgi:hypothetical protein